MGTTALANFLTRSANLLFSSDVALRNRSSMSLLAVSLMSVSALVMYGLAQAGLASPSAVLAWASVALGGSGLMALLVRSGCTAGWRDPALALPQILWAVTTSAFAYVLAGSAKGVVPGAVAVALLFAALNLRAKQIIVVSFYALGVYAVAVLVAFYQQAPSGRNLELIYGLVMLNTLLGCMFLSLRLHQLRKRLHVQRQELSAALAANQELACRDALTGLINRRHMMELIELEQRRCLRGARTMLLVQMDIDHFKSINDTHGHSIGDQALTTFARIVSSNIRSSDVFSRWGGEEFVLLLSDACVQGALQTLNRVRMAVAMASIDSSLPQLRMTVSMGIAEHIPGEAVHTTLERADQALYCAKRTGRNRVVLAPRPEDGSKTVNPSDDEPGGRNQQTAPELQLQHS